jgi:GT2 family glycosyltransferase
VVRSPGAFNFSTLVNRGAQAAGGEYLLLLNNDVEAKDGGWLEALLEQAQQPGVGAVGARLFYPNGRVQHEGVVLGGGGVFACHLDWRGYMTYGEVVREVGAVTAACMMTPAETWRHLGGFDEQFAVGYGDVDYCLRLREAGHRVVYTPYAQLTHIEGASRGRGHPPADDRAARERWGEIPGIRDPYYSWVLDDILRPFATETAE